MHVPDAGGQQEDGGQDQLAVRQQARDAQAEQEPRKPEPDEHRRGVTRVAELGDGADDEGRDEQQRRYDERRAGHADQHRADDPLRRGTNAPRPRPGPDGRVAGVTDARPDVVVIGAGVAGLTAARELSRSGMSVLVLESSPVVGGKLRLGTVGGVVLDVGAESMLARRPEAVDLVAELGLDVVHPPPGSTQLWTRGALRPLPRTLLGVPLDLDALATTGVLSDDGLARARNETVLPLGDEDVSVAELLGSRLGHEVVDRLAEPMLGGVYAGHAATLSARATAPQVVAMLREHGSASRSTISCPSREPGGFGDRHVLVAQREHRLVPGPGEAVVGQHPGGGQRVEVEGNAEQRARERSERAAGPELGRTGRGVDHVEAELRDEVDGLGATRQHRLGTDIEDDPADRPEPQLAAHDRRALQDQDRHPRAARSRAAVSPATPAPIAASVTPATLPSGPSRREIVPRRGSSPPYADPAAPARRSRRTAAAAHRDTRRQRRRQAPRPA